MESNRKNDQTISSISTDRLLSFGRGTGTRRESLLFSVDRLDETTRDEPKLTRRPFDFIHRVAHARLVLLEPRRDDSCVFHRLPTLSFLFHCSVLVSLARPHHRKLTHRCVFVEKGQLDVDRSLEEAPGNYYEPPNTSYQLSH